MGSSCQDLVDKAYETKAVAEILQASPDALQGKSAANVGKLHQAFGIRTVRDLA